MTAPDGGGPAADVEEGRGDLDDVARRILDEILALVPGAGSVRVDLRRDDGATHRIEVGVALPGADEVTVPLPPARGITGELRVVAAPGYGDAPLDAETLGAAGEFVGALLNGAIAVTEAARAPLVAGHSGAPLAAIVARTIGRSVERRARRDAVEERLAALDASGGLSFAYQPITALVDGRVVGFEALARFPTGQPDQWFAEAHEVGLGVALELRALRLALRQVADVPPGCFLALNVSPVTALSGDFFELLSGAPVDRIVLEITEHAPVEDYAGLAGALQEVRAAGVRLAIDDAGAGFASLRHVLRLHPDMIKLDGSLVHRIDTDPVRRAMATSLISFAGEVGSTILAEGIENRFELVALTELGAHYGQGFHLARPGPLPPTQK